VPERFFKENAFSVTITVTRWKRCGISDLFCRGTGPPPLRYGGKVIFEMGNATWNRVKFGKRGRGVRYSADILVCGFWDFPIASPT